jgi:hypothetical protein
MALSNWPTITDDTGTKTDGTILNKSVFDAIKASVEDDLFSAANPTVTAEDIIDEVVDARGSKASLDARLDVALNEDGTPKAVAGQASETQIEDQMAAFNLVRNSGMENWAQGAAAAPDFYTLSGAGAAVARCGSGEGDTTNLGTGTYCAKVTAGPGAQARLTITPVPAALMTVRGQLQGRVINVSARVKASVGGVARLIVDDGVATTPSAYHTGVGSAVEFLTVEHTLSGSATKIDVYLELAAANVAFIGGLQLIVSSLTPNYWMPELSPWQSHVPVVIARAATDGASFYTTTSGSEETAWTLPGGIPANAVSLPGQGFRLRGLISLAANTNSKVANLYVGSNSVVFTTATTSATDVYLVFDLLVLRSNSNQAVVLGRAYYLVGAGTAGTATQERVGNAITCDWTTAQALTVKLDGVAASDMVLKWMVVEFLP